MAPSIPATHSAYTIAHPLKPDFSNLVLITQRPTPVPVGTQVLIRVRAVSLNARDCQIASGTYPAPIDVEAGIVPGSDCAGDIVAMGSDCNRFEVILLLICVFSTICLVLTSMKL